MELNIISFTAFLISLTTLIGHGLSQNPFQTSSAVAKPDLRRCYVCNSYRDPYCTDEHFDENSVPLVYCHEHIKMRRSFNEGKNFTEHHHPFVCRKIIQKVSLSGKTDTRIHRSCGYMPPNKRSYEDEDDEISEDRCYKRAGTYEISMYYCTCLEDKCNHGVQSVGRMGWWALSVTTLVGLAISRTFAKV